MARPLLQQQKRRMALAGVGLTAYLLFHMLSNLSFFSATGFNQFYALYNRPWIRWPIFLLVLLALTLHITVAVRLRRKNRQARGPRYHRYDHLHIPAVWVSISFSLLFLFIVVHIVQALLLDTTNVKAAVTQWFSSPYMLWFYLMGIALLTLHLLHALVNVLQSLGLSAAMYCWLIRPAVIVLGLGFAAIPLSYWMGL